MSVRYAVLAGFLSALALAINPTPVAAVQSVNLAWNPSPDPDIAGYKVYYGSESEYYIADIPDGGATSTELSGLSEGVTYYFAIASYDNSGLESERSGDLFYTIPGIAPPRDITSIQKSPSGPGVIVTWNPSPTAATAGYNVHFGTQSGSYTIQNSFTGTNGEIIDGLDAGVTYFFVVAAHDSSGHESVYSSEVVYTVPTLSSPGPITSIEQELAADAATVTWDPSTSTDVAGYNVYYSPYYTPVGGYYYYSVSVGDTNQAAIYGLIRGVTYYFVVKAYDNSGQESDPSSQASYTAPSLDPPGEITSIEQELTPDAATLTWTLSTDTDVAGYNIYYSPDDSPYGGYYSVSAGDTNQTTIYGLLRGVTYFFVVKAYDNSGQESGPSSQASYTVPSLDPPGDITSIEQELAPDAATLTWTLSTDMGVAGYNVYYSLDDSPNSGYYYAATVGNTNQATVYGLMGGATYYFVVKAYDNSGQESDPSSQASYAAPALDPPGDITSIRQTGESITLDWDPAPSADVIGYNIYFGPYSGYYTGVISVSGTNKATIDGLGAGETYFFAVKSYDNFGRESVPSDEASYTLAAPVLTGPVLKLQRLPVPGFENAFSLTSEDAMPSSWTVEASSDMQTWRTLTTGNEPILNVTVVVSTKQKLFFRLNSFYSDINLQTQTDSENGLPNSFFITTQDMVPYLWAVEFSEDLQNWNTLSTGADSHVKVAVVHAETPALFFRLKGQ